MVTKTRLIKDQIFHVFLQKGPNRLYKDCFHSSTGKCDCAITTTSPQKKELSEALLLRNIDVTFWVTEIGQSLK